MKAVTVKEINQELINRSPKELRDICLRLSKFKKENKELLTYLLFESSDESSYTESVKMEIDLLFEKVNRKSNYFIRKGLRRILSNTRKYIRYSQNKKTEVELLMYFCSKLKQFRPSVKKNKGLHKLYEKQVETVIVKISMLHEDLQYDYVEELEALNNI